MGILLYDKPFKTIDEQIDILESRYKLVVSDKNFARQALLTVSYYDLINGYKNIMMENEVFKPGISFGYLYLFHLFDKNFQNVIFKNSILIENLLKTKISYVLSQDLGVDFSEYLKSSAYDYSNGELKFYKLKAEFERVFLYKGKPRDINKIPQPTQHYIKNHNHLPPWIIMRNVSFGNAINLYRLIKQPYKARISELLVPNSNISPDDKTNFAVPAISLIREIRNIIAHNLRFVKYYSTMNRLPTKATNAITKNKALTAGRAELNDVYACILAMVVLLETNDLRTRFFMDLFNCIYRSKNTNSVEFMLEAKIFKDYSEITSLPDDFLNLLAPLITGSFKSTADEIV